MTLLANFAKFLAAAILLECYNISVGSDGDDNSYACCYYSSPGGVTWVSKFLNKLSELMFVAIIVYVHVYYETRENVRRYGLKFSKFVNDSEISYICDTTHIRTVSM